MTPPDATSSLADKIDSLTRLGSLYADEENGSLRCYACGHRCLIRPGRRGICQVRFNEDGRLEVPWGYAAGVQCDPIEKKPFYHVLPGSKALTFGMLGCDLHCAYCQNWITSQALRDPAATGGPTEITQSELVQAALSRGAGSIVSSYNEPLITAEWAISVFTEARKAGLLTAFVSNGNATPEVLDYIDAQTDAYKVDLKTMSDRSYRQLGCLLQTVLDSIGGIFERGLWLEIVTLLIPGWNTSDAEVRDAARFISSVSPDIPWHVTAFHRDYKMTDPEPTGVSHLRRAVEIGYEEGLRFVYAGNAPGRVGDLEHTRCPSCEKTLIERLGFTILSSRLKNNGTCQDCGYRLPGIWSPPA